MSENESRPAVPDAMDFGEQAKALVEGPLMDSFDPADWEREIDRALREAAARALEWALKETVAYSGVGATETMITALRSEPRR